jgi:threonine dehydrogenase-like Zn-dependent dehydrogenase
LTPTVPPRTLPRVVQGIVYHGPGDIRLGTIADPALREPEDAVVRVTRTAICGSDLHVVHGLPLPDRGFALGHEFVGVVEDVGPGVRRFRKGERVLASCTTGCGRCVPCRRGLVSACEATTAGGASNLFGFSCGLPGGQAEAVRVPHADANLLAVPSDLDDERILFLSDILPTGHMAAELAEVGPGDAVVVLGCGPVGVFAQRCAELRGASRILAADLDDGRLAGARARGYDVVNPGREDLAARVLEWTGGRGADAVIEAVGRPELVAKALELARHGGRVSFVGVILEPAPFFLGLLLMKHLTLRAGIVSPQAHWPRLLPLIEAGRLDPSEIVSHRLPLADGVRGYELFDKHEDGALKVVLQP